MKYGYIKAIENCSEDRDISYSMQLEILKERGVANIYFDSINYDNKMSSFCELEVLIQPGDSIYITKLSRLGNDFSDIAARYQSLISKQVNVKILDLPLKKDDNILEWLKMLDKYENDNLYEKRCLGFLKSKKSAESSSVFPPGKPKKYSKKQLAEAVKLRDKYTIQEVSAITGISKSTIKRATKSMQ